MKTPRTLAEIRADKRVYSIHKEWDPYMGNSWWLYLEDGLICPRAECGTIHEKTLKDVTDSLSGVMTQEEYEDPERWG